MPKAGAHFVNINSFDLLIASLLLKFYGKTQLRWGEVEELVSNYAQNN